MSVHKLLLQPRYLAFLQIELSVQPWILLTHAVGYAHLDLSVNLSTNPEVMICLSIFSCLAVGGEGGGAENSDAINAPRSCNHTPFERRRRWTRLYRALGTCYLENNFFKLNFYGNDLQPTIARFKSHLRWFITSFILFTRKKFSLKNIAE